MYWSSSTPVLIFKAFRAVSVVPPMMYTVIRTIAIVVMMKSFWWLKVFGKLSSTREIER
jgi:hypothetical protein